MQQERDQFSGGPIRKNHRDRHAGAPYRPRQKPHADDQNEKPSRSLFIRNIAYDTKADHILDLFRPYGDIKDTYDQIAGRGILFIHFFDIRASEQAKRDAADRLVGDRPLDVHFSVPKDDIRVIKCDQTKNQGTLLLSLNGSQDILVDKELYEEFQQFGDIKVIRTPNFKKASGSTAKWQRFIEFFDSRAAVDAAKANQGKEYKGGIWDVQYFWDQAFGKPRHEQPRHDYRHPRDHHRDNYNDPYRSDPYRPDHAYPPPAYRPQPPHQPQHQPPHPPPPHHQPPTNPPLDKRDKAQKMLELLNNLQSNLQTQQSGPAVAPNHLPMDQLVNLLTQYTGQPAQAPPPQQPPATNYGYGYGYPPASSAPMTNQGYYQQPPVANPPYPSQPYQPPASAPAPNLSSIPGYPTNLAQQQPPQQQYAYGQPPNYTYQRPNSDPRTQPRADPRPDPRSYHPPYTP